MSKIVVTLFAVCLFFLSSNLFAHETKFELPKSLSNFGSSMGVNGSGNSLLVWNGALGANVYNLVDGEWQLQNYTLKPDTNSTSWKRQQQTIDVEGNYAAFTSLPENKVYVYKWDGIGWDATNIATCPAAVKNIAVSSSGEIAIQSEENDRIYVFSSSADKIIRSYGGGPLSDPKTLNGPMEIDGNIMVVSSAEESKYDKSTIFENWAPIAEISEARAIGINATTKTIVIITSDGKTLELYKYNSDLENNSGWYKADSKDASELDATEFGYSISIKGNEIYAAGIANLDKEYGKYPNHGAIYRFMASGTKLSYRKSNLSKNFTDGGQELTLLPGYNQLIVGDKEIGKTNANSNDGGIIYGFEYESANSVDLILEIDSPSLLHNIGDHVFFQINVINDSESSATKPSISIDFNHRLGFIDSNNNADLRFISGTSQSGSCAEHKTTNSRVICNLTDIAPHEEVSIALEMQAEFVGKLAIFANTYANEFDENFLDNFSFGHVNVSTNNLEQFATQLQFETNLLPSETNNNSSPILSGDGSLLSFQSKTPFIPGTDPNYFSVYLADLNKFDISLISAPFYDQTAIANNSSFPIGMSDDGEKILFTSKADNIVLDDNNNTDDLFTYYKSSGEIVRVSVSSSGEEANGKNRGGDISGNGRFITFYSEANNLVNNDDNNHNDIFIHDLETKHTSRINPDDSDAGPLKKLVAPTISNDGRFIAFIAKPVTPSNSKYLAFLHDRLNNTTNRISISELEDGSTPPSVESPQISDNGNFIYYVIGNDIYKYNVFSKNTVKITSTVDNQPTNSNSFSPSVSANGRFALYTSYASNLVESDHNNLPDIFLYDSESKETKMINIGVGGYQAKGTSYHCAISSDGTALAYASIAHNLTFDDTNEKYDIFFVENPFVANKVKPADIQITNTSPEHQAIVNEEFKFSFYVTNQSEDADAIATNTVVSTIIPEKISIISAKSSLGECDIQEQKINCHIDLVGSSSMAESITVIAKPKSAGKYKILATIASAEEDLDLSNNQTEITINAIEKVDIYISEASKRVSAIYIGETLNLNYTIGNNSKAIANNITAEFEVANDITPISASVKNGTCQIFETSITCIIDEIQPSAVNEIIILAVPKNHGQYDIFGEVSTEQFDNNIENNSLVSDIQVLAKADLTVSVNTTADTIYKGDAITYNIEVVNNGFTTATDTKLIDTISEDLIVESIQTTSGSCEYQNQLISCNLGDLTSGEITNITVHTRQKAEQKPSRFAWLTGFKSTIKAFAKQDHKAVKQGFQHLYSIHKQLLKSWKEKHQKQDTSLVNTASVFTSTPETDLDNNSASSVTEIAEKAYLRLLKTGRGKGSIKTDNISCDRACKDTITKGSRVTITAIPKANSKFRFWAGACKGTNPVCTFNMNRKSRVAIAVFK